MKMSKLITVLTLSIFATAATMALADEVKKLKAYPLKTCIVSGEKLGDGGMTPFTITNGNQIVKFCCKGCVADFKKDPAKFMKKLEAAQKDAKPEKAN